MFVRFTKLRRDTGALVPLRLKLPPTRRRIRPVPFSSDPALLTERMWFPTLEFHGLKELEKLSHPLVDYFILQSLV